MWSKLLLCDYFVDYYYVYFSEKLHYFDNQQRTKFTWKIYPNPFQTNVLFLHL